MQSYPLLAPGLPWIDALFESVSALTTTGLEQEDLVGSSRAHSRRTLGLSSAIASPELQNRPKPPLCADLLFRRLEILAFLVLLCPANWRK